MMQISIQTGKRIVTITKTLLQDVEEFTILYISLRNVPNDFCHIESIGGSNYPELSLKAILHKC